MRGRKRKPAEQHILQGTFRSDRHTAPIVSAAKLPDPPDYLDAEARAEWNRVTAEIATWGVANVIDFALLVQMCEAWSLVRKSQVVLDQLLESKDLGQEFRKVCNLLNESRAAYIRISVAFGVSPAARNGIDTGKNAKDETEAADARRAMGF